MRGTDQLDSSLDDAFMRQTATGDAAAFTQLVARHARRCAALAARLMGSRSEAEDIVQEAFTRLWLKAKDWEPGGAQVSTWLYRVVVNLCLDRKRKPRNEPIEAAAEIVDPAPRSDERMLTAERRDRVQRAVETLPDRQRAALALCHFEEMSNAEAAAILEINIGALESLLVRARRSLRELLSDLAPTDAKRTA